MTKREQYKKVLRMLKGKYKKTAETFIKWSNPLEFVIAVVLSAQCTDRRVNIVTKTLFKKYKTAKEYANADLRNLRREIHSLGFYNLKAKYLKGIGDMLVKKYNGQVPENFDELLTLPGVSRKTANLIVAKIFKKPTGVAVDTHVKRISPRLGWTDEKNNVVKIERDLNKLIDPKNYLDVNEYLIMLGRDLCVSKPKCGQCPLNNICTTGKKSVDSFGVRARIGVD